MSQGKILISINNKDVFLKLKRMRGFSSKTIEMLLEGFFAKVNVDMLWQKYYDEGEESYRNYIMSLINGNSNGTGEKLESNNQVEEPAKKKAKINSSTFWQ